MANRYTYAGPYRSQQRAADAVEAMYASGEISECERPEIERRGRAYYVTLVDG